MNSIDRTLSKLPYVRMMFSDKEMQEQNNKFDMFLDPSVTKDKQVQRLGIVNRYDHELEQKAAGGGAGGMVPMYYHQLMNGISSNDKKRRMIDYRTMASYSEVASAIREICDEMFVKDDLGEVIKGKLRGDYNEEIKSLIQEEFQQFLNIFKIREKGWGYVHDHIVEGELFFENIVSLKRPDMGILGLTRIAAERIDPLYYDLDNELIDAYILRAKQQDQYPYQYGRGSLGQYNTSENQQRLIILNDQQVTYVFNKKWEESAKKYRLPHLAEAHRPYRQLSLIEDATIIYMLVRAPQRLVFKIDTGNLPAAKAEQFIQRMMAKFWTKKTVGANGNVENTYDPQGMLENYYIPKNGEGRGSEIEALQGGDASPDNMEILNFFVQKLYKSLHVPLSRLNSDTAFSDGENISREELRFANFIISVQEQWASAIKRSFITHLKLKGKKIFDVAKKLNVTEVEVNQANGARVQVKDIFAQESSEYFTNKCWEHFAALDKSILETLAGIEKPLYAKKMILEDVLPDIEDRVALLSEQILFESENSQGVINENVDVLRAELDVEKNKYEIAVEELDYINEEIDKLKEMKDDHSSWWEQYDLKEEDLDIELNKPTQFFTIRQQQIFQQKLDNYNNMTQNDMIDNIFMQKECLGWDDKKIMVNMELMRKTAALRWELANIEQNGPDFREKALKEMQGAGSGEDLDLSGLGGGMGGGGGGASLPEPSGGGAGGGSGDTSPEINSSAPIGGSPSPAGGTGGGTPPSAPTKESVQARNKRMMFVESLARYDADKFRREYAEVLKTAVADRLYY